MFSLLEVFDSYDDSKVTGVDFMYRLTVQYIQWGYTQYSDLIVRSNE